MPINYKSGNSPTNKQWRNVTIWCPLLIFLTRAFKQTKTWLKLFNIIKKIVVRLSCAKFSIYKRMRVSHTTNINKTEHVLQEIVTTRVLVVSNIFRHFFRSKFSKYFLFWSQNRKKVFSSKNGFWRTKTSQIAVHWAHLTY